MTGSQAEGKRSLYFPGLNGIRAIAACGVMGSHALQGIHGFVGHERTPGLQLAPQAVIMFFTLSGFLITYLLLEEREQRGKIDLPAFYLRRILRIWPLYFFYLALAVGYHAVFGEVRHAPYLLLFVFFLPNLARNLNRYPADTAHLWSIGIEEQFYAFWPLLVQRLRRQRTLITAVVLVIVGMVGLRLATTLVVGPGRHLAKSFLETLGYDSMAIGALFAILLRAGDTRVLRIAGSVLPQLAFVALVGLLATNLMPPLSYLTPGVTSLVTAMFIVTQVAGQRKIVDLEQPLLSFLGRISFGIYIYNELVIRALARLSRWLAPDLVFPVPVVVLAVAAVTIGIATLSFRYLEAPFLTFKDRLARIRTRTQA